MITVTGHKGFVGSALMPLLDDAIGWDLRTGDDIFAPNFETQVGKSDTVIHLAALTNVDESFEKKDKFVRTNVLGTARVLELCLKYGVKLVYPSSAAVYHRELSPYAETKALAEDLCRQVADFHPVTILRFFNIYGKNMNPDSGSVMYEFMKGAREGKIVIFGDGEQTRDFVWLNDVVKIVKESIDDSWNGVTVDVGSGQAYSINYIAGLFAHYSENDVEIVYEPPRREIKWSVANTDLLKKLYKKDLVTNIEKGIRKVLAHDN